MKSTEHLIPAKHYAKAFICGISLNPLKNPIEKVLSTITILKKEKLGLGEKSNLPKEAKLVNGKVIIYMNVL